MCFFSLSLHCWPYYIDKPTYSYLYDMCTTHFSWDKSIYSFLFFILPAFLSSILTYILCWILCTKFVEMVSCSFAVAKLTRRSEVINHEKFRKILLRTMSFLVTSAHMNILNKSLVIHHIHFKVFIYIIMYYGNSLIKYYFQNYVSIYWAQACINGTHNLLNLVCLSFLITHVYFSNDAIQKSKPLNLLRHWAWGIKSTL